MYELLATNKFKRDLKKYKRQNKEIRKLQVILELLTAGEALVNLLSSHIFHSNYFKESKFLTESNV